MAVSILGTLHSYWLHGHLILSQLLLGWLVLTRNLASVLLLWSHTFHALGEIRSETHWYLLLVSQTDQVWEVARIRLLETLVALGSFDSRRCLSRIGREVEVRKRKLAFELSRQVRGVFLLFHVVERR